MEWEKAGDNDVTAGADWSFSPENLFTASAVAAEVQSHNVRRAETAPTIMTEIAALADADIPESEAYRCTQEYHNFYYSHMPRDPRMPIPIKSRNANTNSQQPQSGSSTSVGSGAGTTPASSPWVVQKSSLTGDIVTHPHTRAGSGTYSNQPAMPGRVVTPATAQQMLNDPHAPIPHGSRVVYVTEPPKAVTPSTLYVLLPEGTAPPPGATVIHAPPSFLSSSGEPSRTGSGVSHLVSANGQILIATTPSPPNQFHSIPHMVAHPMPPPPPQGPSVVIGVRAPLNHPLAPGGNGTYRMQPSQLQPHGHHNASTSAAAAGGVNATVVRHPLLQQYIDTKLTADWNARLIVGHIHHFCRDQDGSRFIQRQLDDSGENVPLIWNEAYPIALDLMCDVFGNYVIQKLFDVADDERRIKLVNLFAGSVMKLSLQTYGCRVLQKAFDSVPSKHIEFVAKELQGHIAECVFDQNANHVVQKCIEKLPSKCQFVADEFLADLSRLACHAYGCRVLQKLFEACYYSEARGIQNPYAPTDLTQLLTTVFHRLDELVVNQFGNYVVQHGMMNCSSGLQVSYIEKISPQVFTLSKSKFGSNVAEKTVELASEAQRGRIIDTLIGDETTASASPVTDIGNSSPTRTPAAEPPLVTMMRDPFANYVVQKLMDRSSPDQQTRMVHVILPYVETIAQATFGKHLLTRMDKMGLLPPSVAATLLSTAKDPTNNTNAKGQQKDRKKQGTERAQTDRPAPAASAHKSAVVVAPPQAVGDATKGQQQPASKGSKRTHRRQRSTASSSASAGTLSAKPTPSTSPATMTLSPPSQTLGANASVTSASVAPRMQHMPYRSPTTDLIAQQHRHTLEDFSLESAPRQQQPQHPAAQYHPQQQQHQQPQQQAQQQQRFAVNQQQQQQQQHSAPHFAPHYQHQQQPPPQQQPPMKSLYPYPHNVDGGASYRPVHQPQHQQQHYLPAATGYHQQPQQQQHQYGGPSPAQQPHQYTPNNGAVPNNAYMYQQQAQQQSRQDEVYAHHQYQPYPVPGGPTPSAYPVPQHVATLGGNGGHAPIDSSQQFHHYPQQQTAPPHSRPQQQQPSAWYDGNGWNINSGAGQPSHVRVGPGAAPPHRQ